MTKVSSEQARGGRGDARGRAASARGAGGASAKRVGAGRSGGQLAGEDLRAAPGAGARASCRARSRRPRGAVVVVGKRRAEPVRVEKRDEPVLDPDGKDGARRRRPCRRGAPAARAASGCAKALRGAGTARELHEGEDRRLAPRDPHRRRRGRASAGRRARSSPGPTSCAGHEKQRAGELAGRGRRARLRRSGRGPVGGSASAKGRGAGAARRRRRRPHRGAGGFRHGIRVLPHSGGELLGRLGARRARNREGDPGASAISRLRVLGRDERRGETAGGAAVGARRVRRRSGSRARHRTRTPAAALTKRPDSRRRCGRARCGRGGAPRCARASGARCGTRSGPAARRRGAGPAAGGPR